MTEETVKELQRYIEDNDNGEVSPSVLWDACKAVMRGKIIAKSAYLKKIRQLKLDTLKSDLKRLEREHKDKLEVHINQEIKKKRAEINENYVQEIQKNLLFVKQRHYEVGGKSTKLLAYKLKKQQAKNNIYKIRDPHTRSTVDKTEEIQKCFEAYYKNLYAQPKASNKPRWINF